MSTTWRGCARSSQASAFSACRPRNLTRLAQGDELAQLAAEYGDDGTRSRGGELGNFDRHKFPTAFTSAAFALAVGETSGIVETRYGFHIIRRTE